MTLRFLGGGGAMVETLREHDGLASPQGWLDASPQSRKTMVGVNLASPQLVLLLRGEAQLMLYNNDNGHSETLGDLPPATGQPFV